ncbi:MAG: hypothetical protein AAFU79_07480 [Myxococcota bacterium]
MSPILRTRFVKLEGEVLVTKTHEADPTSWIRDVRALIGRAPPRVVPPRVLDPRTAVRPFVPGVTLSALVPVVRSAVDYPGPCINLWLTEALGAVTALHMLRDSAIEAHRSHGGLHGRNLVVSDEGGLRVLDWGLCQGSARRTGGEDRRAEDVVALARVFLELYPPGHEMVEVLETVAGHGSLPATAFERRVMQVIHRGALIAPPSAAKHWLRYTVKARATPVTEDIDPTILGELSADEIAELPKTDVGPPQSELEATDVVSRRGAPSTDDLFVATVAEGEAGLEGEPAVPAEAHRPSSVAESLSMSTPASVSTGPEAAWLTRPVRSASGLHIGLCAGLALLLGSLGGFWGGSASRGAGGVRHQALEAAARREMSRSDGPRIEKVRILLDAHDGLLRGYPQRVDAALEALSR